MNTRVAFTCRSAEAPRLAALFDRLQPVLARYGGTVLPAQGPATGFHDDAMGGLAVMRLVAFPSEQSATAFLNDPSYKMTSVVRDQFSKLEIGLIKG